jgi:hypothetical protein
MGPMSDPTITESKNMFKIYFQAALVGMAALLLSSVATATFEFYTEEELFELADIVVDAEVVEVRCNSAWHDGGFIYRRYDNDLMTLHALKGEVGRSFSMQTVDIIENGAIGPGCVSIQTPILPQGWSGRLYLVRNDDGNLGFAGGGSGMPAVKDPNASVVYELPVCEPKADGYPIVPISNDNLRGKDGNHSVSASQGCSVSSGASSWGGKGFAALGLLCLVLARRLACSRVSCSRS